MSPRNSAFLSKIVSSCLAGLVVFAVTLAVPASALARNRQSEVLQQLHADGRLRRGRCGFAANQPVERLRHRHDSGQWRSRKRRHRRGLPVLGNNLEQRVAAQWRAVPR